MFGERYFGNRYFGERYFGDSGADVSLLPGCMHTIVRPRDDNAIVRPEDDNTLTLGGEIGILICGD